MASTPTSFNMGLNTTQIKYFERKIWKQLRVRSLADQLASESGDNVVHRVTDLTNTTYGFEARLTLVPDDQSYGTVGDNQLEDREAGMSAYDIGVTFDQFRKAFKNEGHVADRATWVRFAQQASDQLAYWAITTKDKLMMNTLAGVDYKYEVDGKLRPATCEWAQNRFAADVTPPSSNRHFQITDNSGGIGSVNHSTLASTHVPKWNTFIDMRGALPMLRIKPVRGKWGNGQDLYICLVHPNTMTLLKKDTQFQQNLRDALQRGDKNPTFAGAETYMVDGILLVSHRYAYTTLAAASGSRWGSDGSVHGARSIFLGAQALAMCEMGGPKWVTKTFDYENRMGVSMAIKFGFKKTKFKSVYEDDTEQDFSTVVLDHAIPASLGGVTI